MKTAIFLAIFVRRALMMSDFITNAIMNRIEVSTPINSWKRVTEALYLLKQNIDPYNGDLFHEPPLNLYFYHYMTENLSRRFLDLVYIISDILTATLIFKTCRKYVSDSLKNQKRIMCINRERLVNFKNMAGDSLMGVNEKGYASNIFLKEENVKEFPVYCVLVFLFNPFTLLNCVGRTCNVFINLINAGTIYSMVYEKYKLFILLVSVGTYESLYPIVFLAPALLIFGKTKSFTLNVALRVFLVICTLITIYILLEISHRLTGSWSFLNNVYGAIVDISDLRPNLGFNWYFFTEMFEHFDTLFKASIHINIFVLYILPLSIKFKKDPIFLSLTLIMVTTIFKTYPCVGDYGFYFGIIMIWCNLLKNLHHSFFLFVAMLLTTVLYPVLWQMWIIFGCANANFYFGIGLGFATAQICLSIDIIFSHCKRDFWLNNNCNGMNLDGKRQLLLTH